MTEEYRTAGDEELPRLLAVLPRVAGLGAIAVGGLTLCGWLLEIERLRRPFAAFVAMNPATAVGFILLGAALMLCSRDEELSSRRSAAKALSGVVLLLAVCKLTGLALEWHPNVDELLFGSQLSSSTGLPNRMAPNTAVDFILLSLGIIAIDLRLGGGSFGQLFAVIAAFGALLPLTGYLYGERSFQGLASFIPMAPHTAVLFIFISAGLFFSRPRLLSSQTFATRDPRGVLARRVLPSAIVLTLALGWLRLAGEQRGLYTAHFGTTLFALILCLLFTALIVWATGTVGRADKERHAANLALLASKVELEESLRQTQLIIDHAREIICTIDDAGRFLTVNSATETILGCSAVDLKGSSFTELHAVGDRPAVEAALREVKTGLQTANVAARCVRRDQTLASVAWSLQASRHYGRIFGVGRER